jgi:hypothetical protein
VLGRTHQPPPKQGLPPIRWKYINGTLRPFYPGPSKAAVALKVDDNEEVIIWSHWPTIGDHHGPTLQCLTQWVL